MDDLIRIFQTGGPEVTAVIMTIAACKLYKDYVNVRDSNDSYRDKSLEGTQELLRSSIKASVQQAETNARVARALEDLVIQQAEANARAARALEDLVS